MYSSQTRQDSPALHGNETAQSAALLKQQHQLPLVELTITGASSELHCHTVLSPLQSK